MDKAPINMIVARNIAALMSERELDAAKLARSAGLNPTGVYDILNGKSRSPRIETVEKIATALGVPLPVIFSENLESQLKSEIDEIFRRLPQDRKALLLQTARSWLPESAA